MKTANFVNEQFISAAGTGGLTTAFGTTSGAIAGVGSGAWAVPGILAPDAMTTSFSGLVATIGLPAPWALLAANGVVVHAHGTQTGQDTSNYTVNFAPLVPVTGAVTAFLIATIQTIQQNPFSVPGPPQGHPSFNPNYVPSIGYADTVYTVALSAVTGGVIDNINTFELFRATLTAGQITLSIITTLGQVPAGLRRAMPPLFINSGGVLTRPQAQRMLVANAAGLTNTLPAVSGAGGLTYAFINPTSGAWVISTTSSDRIFGFGTITQSSYVIPASGSLAVYGLAAAGLWAITASSSYILSHGTFLDNSSGTFTVPAGIFSLQIEGWGAGGGGGGSAGVGSAGAGGGGGGYGVQGYNVTPGQVLPYTVGARGTGGIGTGNGGTGGSTTVGLMVLGGGTGGGGSGSGGSNTPGVGGGAGGAVNGFNANGGLAGPGIGLGTNAMGGAAGGTPFWPATPVSNGTGGNGATGWGGGGGANGANGGNGGIGAVRFTW